MRRRCKFPLLVAAVVATAGLGPGLDGARAGQAPVVVPMGRVDLEIPNIRAVDGHGFPCVQGVGTFPIRLTVFSKAPAAFARRNRALVAVYTRPNLTNRKAGELLTIHRFMEEMETSAGIDGEKSFDFDLPMSPGDYIAYYFVCDPDEPYVGSGLPANFPDAKEFPGLVLRARMVPVRVLPKD